MKASSLAYALIASILIQLPLGYLFMSLESLVLGQGFIGIPNGIYLYILLVSASIICLIGLPIYFLLAHFKLNTTINVSMVGIFIPILIITIINISMPHSSGFSAGENYYGIDRSTIENGTRTFWGWVSLFEGSITYSIHGFIGATMFHKLYSGGNNA